MLLKKIKKLYEKHYFKIWYFLGLIPASFWFTEHSINNAGYFLTILYIFIIAVPFALVLWTVWLFTQFIFSIFYSAVKEKNFKLIIVGIIILYSLLHFIFDIF